MNTKSKIFVLVGPPGSGKGSFSNLCIKEFGWKQLSTGNLCRKHIAKKTEIGKQIDFVLKSGKLVSDSIIIDMVNQWLEEQLDLGETVILDGYPRNLKQAEALQKFLGQEEAYKSVVCKVVEFVVSDDTVINRLCSRAICENKECQAVYSLVEGSSLNPKKDMECDVCSSSLYIRPDDKPDAVKERLRIYHEHADALLDFYREKGFKILELGASGSLADIFESFKKKESILRQAPLNQFGTQQDERD